MPDMFIGAKFIKKTLKPRPSDSHKGQNGRVLFVGGSRSYFGSPALAAFAALRAGADLAYLLVPEYIAPTVASYLPDFIVCGYKGEYLNSSAMPLFSELKGKTDCMVIGNGLSKNPDVLDVARKMILEYGREKPCVIDADAIVSGGYGLNNKNAVYTPHLKEFERLSGIHASDDLELRKKGVLCAAKNICAAVLLKGKTDIASDGKKIALNKTGNAGMTCGGTGDTLAGILGALLSQGCLSFEAACCAAYINGLAGDLAFKKFGYSLIASDLICEIPNALAQFNRGKNRRDWRRFAGL